MVKMGRGTRLVAEAAVPQIAILEITCDRHEAFPPGVPRTSTAACECNPGRTKVGRSCEICEQGTYKRGVGNGPCRFPCKACTSTGTCKPGNFLRIDDATAFITCIPCDEEKVECLGEFDTPPFAKPGFFLLSTQEGEAWPCTVMVGKNSTCLGGSAAAPDGSVCLPGHRGYLCGACDVGPTRLR